MNHCVRCVLLTFLLVPLTGLGQSFEWYVRLENRPLTGGFYDARQVYPHDLVASRFGIYALSAGECGQVEVPSVHVCHGVLSKYRAENGKLLWRRRLEIAEYTEAYALVVNDRGVFVVGSFHDPRTYDRVSSSFIRHYSHDGAKEWTVVDGVVREAWDIALDERGLYVIGSTFGMLSQAVIRHFNFEGEMQWLVKLPYDTDEGRNIVVGDGRLYAYTFAPGAPTLDVYRTDGSFEKRISLEELTQPGSLTYQDGFLYALGTDFSLGHDLVLKYAVDGSLLSSTAFSGDLNGLNYLSGLAASDAGLVVSATMVVPAYGGYWSEVGRALIKLDLNGSIDEIMKLPGYSDQISFASLHNDIIFITGGVGRSTASFTGRISSKDLLPPSLVSLAGAAPAQPPRIAVLKHSFGAGPVRVRIRDAAPGSLEYVTEFSEGLKPVAFGKISDLDDNGYEELVVVSRFPAMAEVRDSLDGRLLSAFKLGTRFEPAAASVEERDGEPPRLAVLVRNPENGRVFVQVHDPATGALLDSIVYHPGLNPFDVLPLPAEAGTPHRYAVLLQDPEPGMPSRIQIRGTSNTVKSHYFISPTHVPVQLALMGTSDDPALGILLQDTIAERPRVRQIDLQNAGDIILRYSEEFTPVAAAAIPDIDGNNYPEVTVLSLKSTGQVKAETRDGNSGTFLHRIVLNRHLEPHDVEYVGAIPGFSDTVLGFLQMKLTDDYGSVDGSLIVTLVDGTKGAGLFALEFPATP